jgi:hypothetical protein
MASGSEIVAAGYLWRQHVLLAQDTFDVAAGIDQRMRNYRPQKSVKHRVTGSVIAYIAYQPRLELLGIRGALVGLCRVNVSGRAAPARDAGFCRVKCIGGGGVISERSGGDDRARPVVGSTHVKIGNGLTWRDAGCRSDCLADLPKQPGDDAKGALAHVQVPVLRQIEP